MPGLLPLRYTEPVPAAREKDDANCIGNDCCVRDCSKSPGATIRGEVRDAAGRGIAEARIDVLDAKPLVGEPLFTGYLDCNKFVFTDRRGRFEIANLDPTLQFRLRAVAVDHKSTFTDWFRPTDAGITIQIAEQPDDVPVNRIVFGKMVDSSLRRSPERCCSRSAPKRIQNNGAGR